jgi:hypothetical protein
LIVEDDDDEKKFLSEPTPKQAPLHVAHHDANMQIFNSNDIRNRFPFVSAISGRIKMNVLRGFDFDVASICCHYYTGTGTIVNCAIHGFVYANCFHFTTARRGHIYR